MKKILNNFVKNILFFILIVLILYFQYATKCLFLSPTNVSNMVMQNVSMFILAIGMLIVITTYNIDLSVGVVASFVSALSGVLMIKNNINIIVVIILCLLLGAFIGAIQGFIIEKLKISSLIVTLVSMILLPRVYSIFKINSGFQLPRSFEFLSWGIIPNFFGGKSRVLTVILIGIIFTLMYISFKISERKELVKKNREVKSKKVFLISIATCFVIINIFMFILSQYRGVPCILVILALIIYLYSFISVKNKACEYLFTSCTIEKTQRLYFIKANHLIIFAFINIGILAALSGLILTARLNSFIPITDSSMLFDTLAACYIGGVSVSKGTGTMRGVISGCIIIGVLRNGMSLIGASSFLWDGIRLAILLIAVALDFYNRSKYNDDLKLKELES